MAANDTSDSGTVAEFGKVMAGATALIAGLAAIGKTTGVVDTMLRNHPNWSAALFSLAILAGFVAALAGLEDEAKQKSRRLRHGAFLFFLSVIGSLVLVTIARGERPAPTTEVKVTGAAAANKPANVSGMVTAGGMRSGQTLKVLALSGDQRLYFARIGSDASGNVKLPFAIPIDATKEHVVKVIAWIDASKKPEYCDDLDLNGTKVPSPTEKRPPGCVLVRVPAATG